MQHRAAFTIIEVGLSLRAVCVIALAFAGCVAAAQPVQKSIYTCIDGKGSKRTSDRPIPECADREQRVLNKDGSLKRVIPPTPEPPKPRASGQG